MFNKWGFDRLTEASRSENFSCLPTNPQPRRFSNITPLLDQRVEDGFASIAELDDFAIYAGDGHYYAGAAHDPKRESSGAGLKKLAVGHFFMLNLRNHSISHLTLADQSGIRKGEHDMHAIKRSGWKCGARQWRRAMLRRITYIDPVTESQYVLEEDLLTAERIDNEKERARKENRKTEALEEGANYVATLLQRFTVRSEEYIRWLRDFIYQEGPWSLAVARLRHSLDQVFHTVCFSQQGPGKQKMSREQLIGLIQSDAKFMNEREDIAAYISTLKAGEGLSETAIREGYTRFKAEKDAAELATIAARHHLATAALQSFVDGILARMIFDGEQLSDLMAPLDLGWRARTQAELALMADLHPLLTKRAGGRDISGLSAYEQ